MALRHHPVVVIALLSVVGGVLYGTYGDTFLLGELGAGPDLQLEYSSTPPLFVPKGEQFSYALTLTNVGNKTMKNITIDGNLDSSVKLDAGQSDTRCYLHAATKGYRCTADELRSGSSLVFRIVVTVIRTTISCAPVHSQSEIVFSTPSDENERNNSTGSAQTNICTACADGIDNDHDQAADFPYDYSCTSREDDDEGNMLASCQDGKDNDGDGVMDFPNDTSCTSLQDNNEDPNIDECADGIDNDSDGAVDADDFSCIKEASGAGTVVQSENRYQAECQDDIDNDNDGQIDAPDDDHCNTAQDNEE